MQKSVLFGPHTYENRQKMSSAKRKGQLMKKIICCFMSVMLLLGIAVVPAYAANSEEIENTATAETLIVSSLGRDSLNKALVQAVKEDMELLEAVCLGDVAKGMQINNNGTIVYSCPIDDNLTSYITVSESVAGDVTVTSLEGDLYNELTFTADGRILLNGKNLDAENALVQDVVAQDESIMRAGPISRYYAITLTKNSTGTDVVTPTGFTKGSTSTGTYASLTEYLKDLTVITIKAYITQKYRSAFISIIKGIPSATMSSIIDEGLSVSDINKMKNDNPNSKNINYKATIYSKNGNDTLYAEYIYVIKVYGNANCTKTPAIVSVKKITEST